MVLTSQLKKSRWLSPIISEAIALNVFTPQATAKLFDGPVDKLPVLERVAIREGKVILREDDGHYTCRILVNGSIDMAWQVLTDYKNLENFLFSVADSELVEPNCDRKIFEQINKIKTLRSYFRCH